MGLFSKTPKATPKVVVEGMEVVFQPEGEWWEFRYRGTEFWSFGSTLMLPGKAELDEIVETIEVLKPEMRSRLMKGLDEWGEGAKLDDGETYHVDLKNLGTEGTFDVSWSDGASWGDLACDFTIKDGVIIDEGWGD